MSGKFLAGALLLAALLTGPCALPAWAGPPQAVSTQLAAARALPTMPVSKPGGGKWRIGYFQSGEFGDYPRHLRAVVEGLAGLGWLELPPEIPEDLTGEAMWRFLARNARSDTLEFADDAFWSEDFDEGRRAAVRAGIARHLKKTRGVDLMLAVGTWAGQDMVALGTPVPTVVISASDPIASGIIKSAEDSGQDNLNARVSPGHYRRQVHLFHDVVPFTKLGLIYENTEAGRSYAAIDEIEEEARASGFQMVRCEAPFSGQEQEKIEQGVLVCYERLVKEADAIYLTAHRGMNESVLARVAVLLRQAKIPSFSMFDSTDVKAGILMSMAQADYFSIGRFHAETIARILHGAKPRELPQVWDDPVSLALNLEVARKIGFDPPLELLLAADEIYGSKTRSVASGSRPSQAASPFITRLSKVPAMAARPRSEKAALPVFPVRKPGGGKWRIGGFESGGYSEYPKILKAVVQGLQELGWLGLPDEMPELAGEDWWRFLVRNARSDYLEFVADAYWSDAFDESRRAAVRASVDRRLRQTRDIDLMLALGTWAGQDMAAIHTPVPTLVLSVSNPVGAGIIQNATDSGQDNLNARVVPERYRRQVRLFHEIVPFRKLGLIYENTPAGRTFAAIDEVRAVAAERNFDVITCEAPFSGVDQEIIEQNALSCYRRLIDEVDAVYVTEHRGTEDAAMRKVAALLREARLPGFSMRGSEEVEAGILMSVAQADYSSLGLFHAETIARILHGAKPRQLPQIREDPVSIALNLETARQIGFDPPVDVLLAADEVYGMEER